MFERKTILNDLEWLRQVSEEVDFSKDKIDKIVRALDSYCMTHGVFGMAANQLGINKRIIYLKNTNLDKIDDEERNEKTLLINPKVKERIGLTSYWEACESCLDNTGLVLRPYSVKIEYFDIEGKKHQKTFKGFSSTVFSHEYDHLNGILHIDKALELIKMSTKKRKIWRKSHGYVIISEVGNFLELEKEYAKKYKHQCHAHFR